MTFDRQKLRWNCDFTTSAATFSHEMTFDRQKTEVKLRFHNFRGNPFARNEVQSPKTVVNVVLRWFSLQHIFHEILPASYRTAHVTLASFFSGEECCDLAVCKGCFHSEDDTDLKPQWFTRSSLRIMSCSKFAPWPSSITAARNVSHMSFLEKSSGMYWHWAFRSTAFCMYSGGVVKVHIWSMAGRDCSHCWQSFLFSSSFQCEITRFMDLNHWDEHRGEKTQRRVWEKDSELVN